MNYRFLSTGCAQKRPVGRAEICLECTTFFPKIWKKKFQSALLNPLGRSTGNKTVFKGGLSCHLLPLDFPIFDFPYFSISFSCGLPVTSPVAYYSKKGENKVCQIKGCRAVPPHQIPACHTAIFYCFPCAIILLLNTVKRNHQTFPIFSCGLH